MLITRLAPNLSTILAVGISKNIETIPTKLVESIIIDSLPPSIAKYRIIIALLSITTSVKHPNHVDAYANILYFFLVSAPSDSA